MDNIQRAIEIATTYHAGQFRKQHNTGGYQIPFIVHPMQVMKLVFDWGAGTATNLSAAICHDLIEDTSITKSFLSKELGEDVANIVDELTFYEQDASDPTAKAEQKSKYLESFKDKSLNALIIKLADRTCNVQDFVKGGEATYAAKYAAKAKPLYDAVMERTDKIEAAYGYPTRQSVSNAVYDLSVASRG